MTATFAVSGANLNISFSYTGPTQTITDIATHAAHMLWNRGLGNHAEGVTFASLTNADKLAILDAYISQTFSALARDYYVKAAADTASLAAQTTANTTLIIP